MDAARPSNPNNLFSLQQAAQFLAVEIEVLLKWNEHDILKPIITSSGEIAYTKDQLEKFNTIRSQDSNLISREISAINESTLSHQYKSTQNSPVLNNFNNRQQNNYAQINNYNFYGNSQTPTSPSKSKETKTTFSFLGIVATFSFFAVVVVMIFFSQHIKVNNMLNEVNEKSITYDSTNSTIRTLKNDEIKPQTSDLNVESKSTSTEEEIKLAEALNDDEDEIVSDVNEKEIIESVVGSTSDESNLLTNTDSGIVTYGQKASFRDSSIYPEYSENDDTVNEVFDAEGNIKVSKEDPSESDLLATALGVNSFNQPQDIVKQSSSSTGIITFVILGLIFIYFIYSSRRQLIPNYHSMVTSNGSNSLQPTSYNSQSDIKWEKLIEVDQKTDGTVVINFQGKEYRISKPEMDSESDKFIQRLMQLTKSGEKEIEYDILSDLELSTNTPLSKIVTRLGFVGLKRDLFFPRTSKSRVLFRKYLTLEDLFSMNLTIEDLSEKVDNIN